MGGFSGGTIESFVQFMRDRIEDPALAKMVSHPYSLIPHFPDMKYAETEALPDKGSSWGPQWSEAAQSWGGPFVMHFHNEKIVRMSNALLGWKLGACIDHIPSHYSFCSFILFNAPSRGQRGGSSATQHLSRSERSYSVQAKT